MKPGRSSAAGRRAAWGGLVGNAFMAAGAGSPVYLDVAWGGVERGRLVFALDPGGAPRGAEAVRALCTGELGPRYGAGTAALVGGSDAEASAGTGVYRLDPGRGVYGGLLGGRSVSVYGEKFPPGGDSGPSGAVSGNWGPGVLALVAGTDGLLGSQFGVALGPEPFREPHSIVGRLVRGFGLLREIEALPSTELAEVRLLDSGELEAGDDSLKLWADGDPFASWPNDHPNMGNTQYSNRVAAAQSLRSMGNDYFQKGDFEAAAVKYEKARRYLEKKFTRRAEDAERERAERALQARELPPLLVNIAAVLIKLRRPREAIAACNRADEVERGAGPLAGIAAPVGCNPKLLFRRGRAYAMCREYVNALADLERAQALLPDDAGVASALHKAQAQMAARRQRERLAYAKMFAA